MNFPDFVDFRYFGIYLTAKTNTKNKIEKQVKSPLKKSYENAKHYYKPIYNQDTKQTDIIPNGISVDTSEISTIDVDDVDKCPILEQLLNDCSFIVKTRKGYHFYFNKENILIRNKQCGIADINLNTLYFVPKYYNIDNNEEFSYTVHKNEGSLVDMPQYAIDWCSKLISDKYVKESEKDETGQMKDKIKCKRDKATVKKNKNKDTEDEKNEDTEDEKDTQIKQKSKYKRFVINNESNDILNQILDGLNPERFNNYGDWFIIACVFVNEEYDLQIFDEYSRKGKGYNKEKNNKIINSLKRNNNGYRIATLYYMLKNDNLELWTKIQSERKDFWDFMDTFNHFDIALVYYQFYPNKYIYSNNTWYSLNDKNIYQKLNDCKDELFNNITLTIQNIIIEQRNLINPKDDTYLQKNRLVKKNYNNIGNSNFKKGVIEALCGLYYIDNIDAKLNENINLLAFDDKVFDLTIGQYRDIKTEDYISMTVGYDAPTVNIINKYRKDIDNLLWSIFEDKEVINYWFKTISLGIFGNKNENMYIHTGGGRNGKGLLCNILEKCLSLYYKQSDSHLLTGDTNSAVNPTLANSKYTRMLVLSEPDDTNNKTYKLKTALVKSITGGDTITVRDLYKSNVSFKPKFSVILQCNKKPEIDKLDVAIEQRLKVIHYPFTFVDNPMIETDRKIDTSLKNKLIKDMDFIKAFIGILLEYAYKNKDSNTIELPLKVKEQNTLYFDENNPIKDFLNDCCEITNQETDKIGCRELYLIYSNNDLYKKMDEKRFSDQIVNLNKIQKKRLKNGFYFVGIKILNKNNSII
jgi:P4 family phage/plasmid primase-like protien